jgi:hypothetical protein
MFVSPFLGSACPSFSGLNNPQLVYTVLRHSLHSLAFCALSLLLCPAVGHLGHSAAWPLKSKAAMLLAAVTRQQGPETYSALLPQLVASAAEGPMQVSSHVDFV